ncbi:tetratricopeptide repeat protein [bacterium]|nr:tetratricopeptide repeat protein [bacterium]
MSASRSGSLLRLWALAKRKKSGGGGILGAKHQVKLEADPEWKAAAGEAVVEAPPEEKPAPKEKPKKVVPPEAAVARGPAEPPKRGGKLVIRKRRLEPEPAAAVSAAEADALVQAQAAIAAGRLADAARILSVHLAAHPEDLEAVLLSANLLVQQKDRQGAADLLARTLRERRDSLSGRDLLTLSWRLHELEPESAAAIDVMAEIYESRGQQGEALEKWYQSADIWHRRGDRGASMARLERILSLRPDESKALEALAKLHILEKQPEAAVETLLRLARVYLDKDMLGAAGEACQRALKLFPESVPVLLLSSEIHARRGLEAESTQALLSAAAVHEAAGEPLAAVQLLFSSLEKHPERSGLRERLADLLAGMGRRDAAAAEYALLAEHWSERDLLGKAVEAIRRAAELHPENAALRERWLGLLLEKGDHAAAAELLERWAAEAEEAGDFETALACLERLLALAPAGGALRCRLIELWVAAGQAPLGYERLRSFLEDAEARGDAAEREALLALQAKHWPDRGMVEAPESVLAAPAAPVESAVERAAGRLARYRDENERERAAAELPELLAAVVEAGEVERAVALYSETRAWAALPAHVALEFAEMLARAGRGDAAADVLVSAAEEARGAGERSAAEAAYRRAVELDGNNPRVWQARLAFLREDASAREEARAAALALAEVYVRRDQAARALRLLDEVYREDPLAFEVLVRRIELEVEEGHPDRAAALCLEAAAQAPVETALSLLLRATDLSPQDPETWQALYRHHAAAGRVADALSALGTLLDLLERKGLVGKCLALLEEARGALCSGGPEADEAEMTLLLRLARLYEAKGDWRAAAREYLRLAELSERREGIEPALGWVRKGLERDPDFLRLRLVEARLLSRMIPPGDAARRLAGLAATLSGRTARDASADALLDEVLAELLTLSPEHVEGLLLLARRQLEREQPDEARRCYLRACEAAEQTEQWEAALTAAEAVRRLDPQDPEILLRLATLYQRRGEPARAVVCRTQRLEAMLAAWRERPAARRRSAVLSEAEAILALEPGSEAARRARIAVFEKDGETEALRGEWYALLEIQSASGQHLPQLETYRQLLSLEPDNVALRHRFAVHLEGLGRLAEAVEEYLELAERLAESQPMAAEAHWRRALQLEPGCERARQALTAREPEAAAADPLSEADAALAAGDARAAEAVYRQLVLERPREVAVRERLVRLYVSLGDSARAIAEIEELCRLYEEEGRLLETVELLRQAVELEPGRWQLHSALGDRYQRFGNFASAEAAYREALRLLPAGREAERRELHRQLVAVTPGNLESLSTLERCLSEGALSAGERLEADGVRLDILRLLSLEPPSRRVLAEAEQVVGRLTSEGEAAREAHALLAGIAMRVSPAHAGSHRVYLAVQDYLSDRESDALEEAAAALALPQLESVDLAILCELLLRLGAEAEHLGAARRLADRLLSTGRIEEGLAQWRLLVERHPRDLGLRADWIAALENAGARAEAQAEKLALSALHLDLGERVEAIRWCRAALSLPAEEFNRIWEEGAEEGLAVKSPFLPEDVPVLLRLAEIHRAGGRAREEARVWKLLSAHCADLGQSQEAIAYARRVLALAPDDTAAHAQLAALYEATGDAAGALAARVELARVFLAKEAPERALATYRAALERNPDALEVREELASVLADLGRAEESTRELLLVVDHLCAQGRGEEALARLERFVEKDPGSPALREARARQLLALGREVEAVGEYVALGDVYRRLELTRKAQESYERALVSTAASRPWCDWRGCWWIAGGTGRRASSGCGWRGCACAGRTGRGRLRRCPPRFPPCPSIPPRPIS